MASDLYGRDILRWAAALSPERLDVAAPGVVERRAPTCGSVIRARILTDDAGRIARIAFDAQACALGQASAALLAANAPGMDAAALMQARAALAALLVEVDDVRAAALVAPWPALDVLLPARAVPGRHGSVLLPYDAARAAFALAAAQQSAA